MNIEGKQLLLAVLLGNARMVENLIKMVEVTKLGCKIHTIKKNTEHYNSALEPTVMEAYTTSICNEKAQSFQI